MVEGPLIVPVSTLAEYCLGSTKCTGPFSAAASRPDPVQREPSSSTWSGPFSTRACTDPERLTRDTGPLVDAMSMVPRTLSIPSGPFRVRRARLLDLGTQTLTSTDHHSREVGSGPWGRSQPSLRSRSIDFT